MKAAVVHEFGAPLKIEEAPIPTPGYGEVLIRVIANGVCHTDLHSKQQRSSMVTFLISPSILCSIPSWQIERPLRVNLGPFGDVRYTTALTP